MDELVAVLSKKDRDATRTAVTMIEALVSKDSEVYGIASPATIKRGESLETLKKLKLNSPIVVGCVFPRALLKEGPQPLRLKDAAMIFDGRMYRAGSIRLDAMIVAEKLGRSLEQTAATFIKQADGDYAFAVADRETIVAGRDVLGIRPLYYGESADLAVLASERKALWSIGIAEARSFPPGCVSLVGRAGFKFTVAERIIHTKPKQISLQTAAGKLQNLLEHSVEERVMGLKEVAVAFSGGLDSSIIAHLARRTNVNVILIHVSLKNEPEVKSAEQAAEELKLPLYSYVYDEHDVHETIQRVVRAIEEPDPVKVSIGVPIYWTAERAAGMGCRVMLAGQGADELFGGYRRYLDDFLEGNDDKVEETMFNDIVGMYEANLERDFKICNHFNVELRLPFATRKMARLAISLPLKLKLERMDKSLRKLVLRRVARNLGLPQPIADRPKKAIQYTTGTSKAIKKIANLEGVSTTEYLQKVFQSTFRRFRQLEGRNTSRPKKLA